ncbi:transcriptional regulator, TetR family [Rhizobiales bacterium GAS191]|jgi:AcrR family transcriptional regulator|nr:transcriptional regulator, TetR family [Rhizobiales bacterium GAS113]SED55371.1 transcriptional regulator, TetR family [Rhizobiales bacterium GAS191]SEE79651.1 transcriptional regulator, TetR family [Rhizobiales bacterium GAS188]
MSSQTAREKSAVNVRTPRLRRGKARVVALMAAGEAVFAEQGYDAATMTEIAARATASIGSLYQFFPTKELLAATLHGEQLDALSRRLDELRQNAAGEAASKLADRLFGCLSEFLVQHPAFIALADRRPVDKARKRATRTRMQDQIAALLSQASPPLPPGRSEIMAAIILQLMKAAVALSGGDDELRRDAMLAELRQMLRTHLESIES